MRPIFLRKPSPLCWVPITFLEDLRAEKDIGWIFFSSAGDFFAGRRLGHYRLGDDKLVSMRLVSAKSALRIMQSPWSTNLNTIGIVACGCSVRTFTGRPMCRPAHL